MFGRRKRSLSDFNSEIQSHLDIAAGEFREEGLEEREARYAALRQFGNVTSVQERFYESGRWACLDALGRDLRFAARMMRKESGSTTAIILTLALAIGITTAIFSLVNALLFTHLPYRDPERLMLLDSETSFPLGQSHEALDRFRRDSTLLEDVAVYTTTEANLLGSDTPAHVTVAQVTANFPAVLGAVPVACRLFAPNEDHPGNESAALISDHLWRARFGADPSICGRKILLNNTSFTVIGILPSNFDYPPGTEIWTPTCHSFMTLSRQGGIFFQAVARIKPSATMAQALAQQQAFIYASVPRIRKDVVAQRISVMQSLQTSLSMEGRKPTLILFGAALLVLLIAGINVAGLVMARLITRRREFAIRQALGITGTKLLRQLLVEHILLGIVGGVTGLLIAIPAIDYLNTQLPKNWPSYAEVTLDLRVFLFSIVASITMGIGVALMSSLGALRSRRSYQFLSSGEHTGEPFHHSRWRAVLVCLETALALLLLCSSGILLKSFLNRLESAPGFITDNLLTITVSSPTANDRSGAPSRHFYEDALVQLHSLPNARYVSGVNFLPVNPQTGVMMLPLIALPGQDGGRDLYPAFPSSIAPGYFKTMGIELIAGRDFGSQDTASSEPAIILDKELARYFFPHKSAIGMMVSSYDRKKVWTVVGVVDSILFFGPGADRTLPIFYLPYTQSTPDTFSFVIRTEGSPLQSANAARNAIQKVDPDQPISEIASMEGYIKERMQRPRSLASLISGFAFLGYALVLVGVYGTIAHAAGRRIREFGIRIALGAEPRRLLLKSMAGSFLSLLPGIILGAALSFSVSHLLESEVYGIKPNAPEMLIAFSLFILATAAIAGAFASRRILQVDPITVLRHE